MDADWNTFYREGVNASDALQIVSQAWLDADPESEEEAYLQRVKDYLQDRFDIAMSFCDVITGRVDTDEEVYECDIPF